MDFVVAGLGIGALMVVIGFVVRDIGPIIGRQNRTPQVNGSQEQRARTRALYHEISTSMGIGGGVILVATLIAVVLGLSDSVGGVIVLVATVIGIGYAAASIVQIVMANRRGLPIGAPSLAGRPLTFSRRSDKTPVGAEAAPTVRRVESKRSEPKARSTELAIVPKDPPPPDEPFDVTRLFPYEFDEEYQSESTAPESVPSTSKAPDHGDKSAETPNRPDDQTTGAEPTDAPAVTPIAELPSGKPAFRSPLLADIGAEPVREPAEGQFSSRLLADVDPGRDSANTYESPLLADLAKGSRSGSTQADPEDSTDDEPVSKDDDDQPADEAAIDEASVSSTTPERG